MNTNWLKVKWSLWRFAVPAVCNAVLSLICYFIGWHLSTKASAMPLARSGALATAIAIWFTLYDYRRLLEASQLAASQTFKKATKPLPLTGQASQNRIDRKLQENTRRTVRVIAVVQAIILSLATLVWGFGDLANFWISPRSVETWDEPLYRRPLQFLASEVLHDLSKQIEGSNNKTSNRSFTENGASDKPIPVEIKQPDHGALQTVAALITHNPVNDYHGFRRVMHRVTLAGDRPR